MTNPLNEPRKVIPLPSHVESRFVQAWEDAHSPNWHHPADAMREFVRELLAEKSKNEADMLGAFKVAFVSLQGDCGKAFRDLCPATWRNMDAAIEKAGG